jgi:hypothetical protein
MVVMFEAVATGVPGRWKGMRFIKRTAVLKSLSNFDV